MSGLIVDILYPNKYSRWRNLEVKFFIRDLECDVLVYKCDEFAGHTYDFDWIFCNDDLSGLLDDYNILIFDPKYNYINKFNSRIDGTKFNGLFSGSYLITKKENFILSDYEFVYHIFMTCYERFKRDFRFTKHQFIHLYPGGGWQAKIEELTQISNSVKIISTNPYTTQLLKSTNSHYFLEVGTGIMFDKNDNLVRKSLNRGKIRVCFSSLGLSQDKGDRSYIEIVNSYKSQYPSDYVDFISIGNCELHPFITPYKSMNYKELNLFYRRSVDIYVNLETGYFLNGWPIGLEAVREGACLITTDKHHISRFFNLSTEPIYVTNEVGKFVDIIKNLHDDRELLNQKSKLAQDFAYEFTSYESQQLKIRDFIEKTLLE